MAGVAIAAAMIWGWVLYQVAIEEQRGWLLMLAQSQARMIESVARFDAEHSQQDHPQGAWGATMSQIAAAHEKLSAFGETGEFVFGRREGKRIVFLLKQRYSDFSIPESVPFSSDLAEPMRLALTGRSGTLIGKDYRNVPVLAAHKPVAGLGIGIVAKIDLSEVRAPFIRIVFFGGLGAFFIIITGAALSRRVTTPLLSRLETAVDNLSEAQRIARLGNWEWDIAGNSLWWSDEIYRTFGIKPGTLDVTYEAFLDMVHPDDRELVVRSVNDALERKNPYDLDHRIVLADGTEKRVHEQAEVTFDDDGAPFRMTGTVQDITEKALLQDQLSWSRKLEAMGRMTTGIAHEFNNALNLIGGYVWLARNDLDDGVAHDDDSPLGYLNNAIGGINDASEITKELLSFSRKAEITVETVAIGPLIEQAAKLIGPILGDGIKLDVVTNNANAMISVDKRLFTQAIINLATNAAHAMSGKGEMSIICHHVRTSRDLFQRHRTLKRGPLMAIIVCDNGSGMDDKTVRRIFEPFFSTKPEGEGTGMGLSMVYGLIKQLGGAIEVESEVGSGTTFTILLPVEEDAHLMKGGDHAG